MEIYEANPTTREGTQGFDFYSKVGSEPARGYRAAFQDYYA